MEGLIKRAKGFLILVGFCAFAFSILTEPNIDVQAQFTERGFDIEIFAALFVLGGVINFGTALYNMPWLGIAFAPYFVFMGFAVEAAQSNPALSGSTAVAYMFLGALLFGEYIIDNGYIEYLWGWLYRGRGN